MFSFFFKKMSELIRGCTSLEDDEFEICLRKVNNDEKSRRYSFGFRTVLGPVSEELNWFYTMIWYYGYYVVPPLHSLNKVSVEVLKEQSHVHLPKRSWLLVCRDNMFKIISGLWGTSAQWCYKNVGHLKAPYLLHVGTYWKKRSRFLKSESVCCHKYWQCVSSACRNLFFSQKIKTIRAWSFYPSKPEKICSIIRNWN